MHVWQLLKGRSIEPSQCPRTLLVQARSMPLLPLIQGYLLQGPHLMPRTLPEPCLPSLNLLESVIERLHLLTKLLNPPYNKLITHNNTLINNPLLYSAYNNLCSLN